MVIGRLTLTALVCLFSTHAFANHLIQVIEGRISLLIDNSPIEGARVTFRPDSGYFHQTQTGPTGNYAANVDYDKLYYLHLYWDPRCGSFYDPFSGSYRYHNCTILEENEAQICAEHDNAYPKCKLRNLNIDDVVLDVDIRLEHVVNFDLQPGACKIEGQKFFTDVDVRGRVGCREIGRRGPKIGKRGPKSQLKWSAASPVRLLPKQAKVYCAQLGGRLPTLQEAAGLPRTPDFSMHLNFDARNGYWLNDGSVINFVERKAKDPKIAKQPLFFATCILP